MKMKSFFSLQSVVMLAVMGILFSSVSAYAVTYTFYPDQAAYVDRNLPKASLTESQYVDPDGEAVTPVNDGSGLYQDVWGNKYPVSVLTAKSLDPTRLKVRDTASLPDDLSQLNIEAYYKHARTYLQFNSQQLQATLAGHTILDVTLHLYEVERTSNLQNSYELMKVHKVFDPWVEDVINWDAQSSFTIDPAGVYGECVFDPSQVNPDWEQGDDPSLKFSGWRVFHDPVIHSSTLSLADLVQDWLGDGQSNFGLMLEDDFDANWWHYNVPINTSGVQVGALNELQSFFYRYDQALGGVSSLQPYLSINAQPIPEPSSFILLSLGLLGVRFFKRRRK